MAEQSVMKTHFFPRARTIGLLKSNAAGGGPCQKANQKEFAHMIPDQELGDLADKELKAACDMTDREAEVMAYSHLVPEILAKLDLYRQRSGERVGLDAAGLATLFRETSSYTGKAEVYDMVAEELATSQGQAFFGAWEAPDASTGVWQRQPRAGLDQLEGMAVPLDVLCGISTLGTEKDPQPQPNFLVKAGALAALAQVYTPKKKTVVVQRVGETWILAGKKYDGTKLDGGWEQTGFLNMNSEGLQLERLLAGMPQYLDRKEGMPAFANYAYKQVFVVKEVPMPGDQRLHIYYHNFLYSAEKTTKGRILVDSSSQPQNHKMKRKDNLKRTFFEMWARDQRYIHHTVWDRTDEYKMVQLPVRPLPAAEAEAEGEPCEHWIDREEVPVQFTRDFIHVRVPNGNKRIVRPLSLQECWTMEDVARQAFDKPDEDVRAEDELALYSQRIVTNLQRIGEALNHKEKADGTEHKWYSFAYYIDREKLRQGIGNGDVDIFEDRNVYQIHCLVQRDRLDKYIEMIDPKYAEELRQARAKGRAKGERNKDEGKGEGRDAHKGGKGRGKGNEGNNNANKGKGNDNQAHKGGGKDKGRGKA